MGEWLSSGLLLWVTAWQSALALVLGLAVARWRRRHPAGAHDALYVAVLASLLLPAATLVALGFELAPIQLDKGAGAPAVGRVLFPGGGEPAGGGVASAVETSAGISIGRMLSIAWLAVAAVLLLRLAVQVVVGRRLVRRSRPLINERIHGILESAAGRLALQSAPIALTTDTQRCPAIWCWSLHPALLVPAGLVKREDVNWPAIFGHELGHLHRGDHVAAIVAELATCVLFFNPLVWIARGRLGLLADQCCDDLAIVSGVDANDYAQTLLSLVPQQRTLAALSMVSGKKSLHRRLHHVLHSLPAGAARDRGPAILLAVAFGLLFAAGLCAMPPYRSNRPSLVSNGGFESGTYSPESWYQGAAIDGVEYVWDAGVAHSGSRSLLLVKTENRYFPIAEWLHALSAEVPPEATHLRVAAWVKAENVTKAILDAQFIAEDEQWSHAWAAYVGARENAEPPANHDWKLYEGTVEIPQGTRQIHLALQTYGPGAVWFDDVSADFVTQQEDAGP